MATDYRINKFFQKILKVSSKSGLEPTEVAEVLMMATTSLAYATALPEKKLADIIAKMYSALAEEKQITKVEEITH